MAEIKRNLESGGLYVNRWMTGIYTQRSPLFVPMSAMGLQLISRMDTLWDGLNAEVSHNNTIQRRPGFARYCSTAFGASDYPLAYYSFRNTSGTIKAMVDTPTKVAWFDATSINTVFVKSTTAQTSFQKVGDTLYFGNGVDLKKWDGTTVTNWGITSPATAPTLSFSPGTLSPTSGYQYCYVYKNGSTGHISSASPVSAGTGPLTSQNITVHGASSTDPQVDNIDIYRNDDGGGQFYYLATVANGGTWSYTDSTADTGLNDDLNAPLADVNDPPPAGANLVKFHMGRMWVAAGNLLYFGGGPDIINGVPEECFPPSNVYKLPSKITALVSMSIGLAVFTQDDVYLVTGNYLSSFALQLWQQNFGVASSNCIAQDGDLLFVFTSQGQLFQFNASGLEEIGFPIQAKLAAYSPANVYLALHRSGADEGLFISNGSSDVWRFSIAMGAWSPVAQPAGGVKAIASIEVATADYRLMVGRAAASGYLLSRSTTSFTDDGTTYSSWVVVGSLILSPPRGVTVVNSVALEVSATGAYPTLSVLLNEISGTFTVLPNPVPDPPQLLASTSVRMMRHDLKAAQSPIPQHARHMQVKVDFGTANTQNELYGMAVV